ncbi:uncharacterized protein LOC134437670 [Engraulis encrasicolus]|uniref:uncharacterized protein LOC134437670 n=1 Tax=Engraulis encrasicolus TaxID=184585 RepID=UPI002FCF6B59
MHLCLPFTFLLFLLNWPIKAMTGEVPTGIIETECRDRYLEVNVRLDNAMSEPRFEAIGSSGLHPLTKEYGAMCGYYTAMFRDTKIAEMRASYFACHTKQDSDGFTFNLLIMIGEEMTYTVSKTCTLPLPLSPREVICELDYMEVITDSTVPYPISEGGVEHQSWDSLFSTVHSLASPDWQLMFLKEGQQSPPLSLTKARQLGYRLHFAPGRVVLRTPYNGPLSLLTTVDGVPVEVVHAVLFSRQRWSAVIFDLVAVCSADQGSFDGTKLKWQVPAVTLPLSGHAGLVSEDIHVGVKGRLLDPQVAAEWGYNLTFDGDRVNISIPFGAAGGQKHSFVAQNTYLEIYSIYLYYKGVFMDSIHTESRHWYTKLLMTPLLPHVPFTVNRTILEERSFTVYLRNIPLDVVLTTVNINDHQFAAGMATDSEFTIVEVPHDNRTHGYVLKVPFEDPIVRKWYFREGVLKYLLNVNFTLNIMNQEDYYFHQASFEARIHDVYPPSFDGQCMDHGIVFKLLHNEFDFMWNVTIGEHPLTEQFAAMQGYHMVNDSQGVVLDVPLFTPGYVYEGISLERFFGSFEILSKDARTREIQKYSAKRCPFQTTELIVCSPRGVMIVAVDVQKSTPQAVPQRTTLLDPLCTPKETDDSRVLFEFQLSTCGTVHKVKDGMVTFENMILFEPEHIPSTKPVITRDTTFELAIRCSYPVTEVNMDSSFKSTIPGFGSWGEARNVVKAMEIPLEPVPSDV